MKDFDKFIEEAALKRCPPGKYYDGNKCVIPPRGYHVGRVDILNLMRIQKMDRMESHLMGLLITAVMATVAVATVQMVEMVGENNDSISIRSIPQSNRE